MTWKVSYECLRDKMSRMPFWKRSTMVEADNRAEAIRRLASKFPPPIYGNYRASAAKNATPSCWFA